MNFDEAFKILEIEPTDDKKKIKIAYSKMLKKYHPEDFPEIFMKINEAYRVALEFEKTDFDEVKSENKITEKNNENEEFFERVKKNFEENKEKSFIENFEDIFSDEKNESEFEHIFSYFISIVKEYKGIGVASVVSAMPLTKSQEEEIEKKLLATTEYHQMEMNYSVDESLIGGMTIRIKDRVIDSSIKTKLYNIKKNLLNVQI